MLAQPSQKTKETGSTQSSFNFSKLYVWVKGLECKVNNLLREVDILKNNFIKKNSEFKKEVKTLNEDFLEFKHQQDKTLEKMDLIIKELKKTAGMEEVMVLKKYVEFWNPMNFVTQRDLDKALESKISLIKNENKQNNKQNNNKSKKT